jgi:hypothetical protein
MKPEWSHSYEIDFPEGEGDCLTCCLASIFETRYEDTPYIGNLADNLDEIERILNEWLKQFGVFLLCTYPNPEFEITHDRIGYHIRAFQVGPELYHAVVYKDNEMVHDPSNLEKYNFGELYAYIFFGKIME